MDLDALLNRTTQGSKRPANRVWRSLSLHDLPVEILYTIHLYAGSPHFGHISKRIHSVLHSAPPGIHARYILSAFNIKHDHFWLPASEAGGGNAFQTQGDVDSFSSLDPLDWRHRYSFDSNALNLDSVNRFSAPANFNAWPFPFDSFYQSYTPVPLTPYVPPTEILWGWLGDPGHVSAPAWEILNSYEVLNFAISTPLCDQRVLEAVVRISDLLKRVVSPQPSNFTPSPPIPVENVVAPGNHKRRHRLRRRRSVDVGTILLPKRLFRSLHTASPSQRQSTLSYLQYIYTLASQLSLKVSTNADGGHALVWAVQALDRPIIELLLEQGADPGRNKALAVQIAIAKGEVDIVKLLVEEMYHSDHNGHEKPEMGDLLLARALRCKVTEIVDWLCSEKGCVPDIHLLELP